MRVVALVAALLPPACAPPPGPPAPPPPPTPSPEERLSGDWEIDLDAVGQHPPLDALPAAERAAALALLRPLLHGVGLRVGPDRLTLERPAGVVEAPYRVLRAGPEGVDAEITAGGEAWTVVLRADRLVLTTGDRSLPFVRRGANLPRQADRRLSRSPHQSAEAPAVTR